MVARQEVMAAAMEAEAEAVENGVAGPFVALQVGCDAGEQRDRHLGAGPAPDMVPALGSARLPLGLVEAGVAEIRTSAETGSPLTE